MCTYTYNINLNSVSDQIVREIYWKSGKSRNFFSNFGGNPDYDSVL